MRAPAKSFKDLVVWQKAHAFVLAVYALTEKFPKHELFGLTSQMRRAAVSIPANIAEGFTRTSNADKERFYSMAKGSLEECRYFLVLAHDLGYGDTAELQTQIDEVGRLVHHFRAAITLHAV